MLDTTLRTKKREGRERCDREKKKGFSRFPFFVDTKRVKQRCRCDALRRGKRFMKAVRKRTERQERVIKRHADA